MQSREKGVSCRRYRELCRLCSGGHLAESPYKDLPGHPAKDLLVKATHLSPSVIVRVTVNWTCEFFIGYIHEILRNNFGLFYGLNEFFLLFRLRNIQTHSIKYILSFINILSQWNITWSSKYPILYYNNNRITIWNYNNTKNTSKPSFVCKRRRDCRTYHRNFWRSLPTGINRVLRTNAGDISTFEKLWLSFFFLSLFLFFQSP